MVEDLHSTDTSKDEGLFIAADIIVGDLRAKGLTNAEINIVGSRDSRNVDHFFSRINIQYAPAAKKMAQYSKSLHIDWFYI